MLVIGILIGVCGTVVFSTVIAAIMDVRKELDSELKVLRKQRDEMIDSKEKLEDAYRELCHKYGEEIDYDVLDLKVYY